MQKRVRVQTKTHDPLTKDLEGFANFLVRLVQTYRKDTELMSDSNRGQIGNSDMEKVFT